MLYGQCERTSEPAKQEASQGVRQTIKRNGREEKTNNREQQRKQQQAKKDGIAASTTQRERFKLDKIGWQVPKGRIHPTIYGQKTFQEAVGINNSTRVQVLPRREREIEREMKNMKNFGHTSENKIDGHKFY